MSLDPRPRRAGAEQDPDDPFAPAIRVRGLVKRFGDLRAVDRISFDVGRGEIFGFLGPNGSGKTTTIRMLTGSLGADAGAVSVLGHDMVATPELAKRRIGYMSQKFALFEDLTVEENLRFYAGIYRLPREKYAAQRAYILSMAGLVGREDEPTANLSVGWRQRLALGTATIHDPELLFLDEPTSGVDPVARRQFWDLLYELANRGVTLFVTTHYMEEASHCHRLAFLHRGRLVAEGTPSEIRALDGGETIVEVRVDDADALLGWLEGEAHLEGYLAGDSVHVTLPLGVPIDNLRRRLDRAGFVDAATAVVPASIEDVFIRLVSRQTAS